MTTSHCQKTVWKNRAQDLNHRSGQRHLNPQPKQANHFSMQTENNPSKKRLKGFRKSTKCDQQRHKDKPNNIVKENQLTKKDYTKKGPSKP